MIHASFYTGLHLNVNTQEKKDTKFSIKDSTKTKTKTKIKINDDPRISILLFCLIDKYKIMLSGMIALENRNVMDIVIIDQGYLLKEKKDMKIQYTQKMMIAGFQFHSFCLIDDYTCYYTKN